MGVLAPLERFLGPVDLAAIAERGELADGTAWRAPITLTVPESIIEAAVSAGEIELTDPEGMPIASVGVDQTWQLSTGRRGVAGSVRALGHHEFGAFRRLFRAPADVRREHHAAISTPVTAPLTDTDIANIREAAEQTAATPLLLACVGHGSPRGVSGPGLIRATLAAAELVGPGTVVVAVPVASRDDEASDAWLRSHVAHTYADFATFVDSTHGQLPPSVATVVEQDRPSKERQGFTVFFTGLSGSGKSTLARALTDYILELGTRTVTLLDGDVVRRHLSAGLGFSREDRETNIRRIGFVAAEIGRHGGLSICSPIAPFATTRAEVRAMHDANGAGFVLVHVATPLEECERRDRKGLYAKARAGEIPDFTGISSPYEEPVDAALRLDTTGRLIADCLDDVLRLLRQEGWLNSPAGAGDDRAPRGSGT
jgi:sulfate adenylyltransferase